MPDLLPLPSTNATCTCQPPGVVLWIIYVEADLHYPPGELLHIMLHPVGQLYPSTTDWCRLFSSYSYTYASSCERCSHVKYSRVCVIFLIVLPQTNTLAYARLPPVTHPPTPRTRRQPAGFMWMNKKRICMHSYHLPPSGHLTKYIPTTSYLLFCVPWPFKYLPTTSYFVFFCSPARGNDLHLPVGKIILRHHAAGHKPVVVARAITQMFHFPSQSDSQLYVEAILICQQDNS